MTKDQIEQWAKSSIHIITDFNECDSDGNHYARDVFRNDRKFYVIEYGNGEILPVIKKDDRGRWIRTDDYVLKEVKELKEGEATRYVYVANG